MWGFERNKFSWIDAVKIATPGGSLGDPSSFLMLPHLKNKTKQNLTCMQGWRPPQAWFALNIRQHFENIAEIHSEPFFPLPQKQGQNSPADGSEYFQVVVVLLLLSILESVREVKEGRTLGEDEKHEGKLKGLVAAENS